jgi:hypothetical protein
MVGVIYCTKPSVVSDTRLAPLANNNNGIDVTTPESNINTMVEMEMDS